MNNQEHHPKSRSVISSWITNVRIRRGAFPDYLKSIVEGEIYDTKTATEVAVFEHYPGDNYYLLEEHLYQNKNGKFFLTAAGMGGTPYGYKEYHNGEYVRGHVLLPLTDEQAKKWLELRELVDEFIEIFGCPDEAS